MYCSQKSCHVVIFFADITDEIWNETKNVLIPKAHILLFSDVNATSNQIYINNYKIMFLHEIMGRELHEINSVPSSSSTKVTLIRLLHPLEMIPILDSQKSLRKNVVVSPVAILRMKMYQSLPFTDFHNWILNKENFGLRCGSCQFDKASNDEFRVKFWMFVLIFFSADIKIRSGKSPIQSKLSLLS